MKITDFYAMDDEGVEIQADPYGNNISITCSSCGHPILLTALENQRGNDKSHPAKCKGCGQLYYLDIREHKKMLYVQKL